MSHVEATVKFTLCFNLNHEPLQQAVHCLKCKIERGQSGMCDLL